MSRRRWRRASTFPLVLVPLATACGGVALDLGSTDLDAAGYDAWSSDARATDDARSGADADTHAADASPDGPVDVSDAGPPAQVWKGYIESYWFHSGSSTVVMTLVFEPNDNVKGTVYFGDAPPLPAPVDPNKGYACDDPLESFAYTTLGGRFVAQRLTLSIASHQIYDAWCRLLTPPEAGGWCLPNWGNGGCTNQEAGTCCITPGPPDAEVPVDCCKMDLCLMEYACGCTSWGCVAGLGSDIAFDLNMTTNHLDGSTTGRLGTHNVHLIRVK